MLTWNPDSTFKLSVLKTKVTKTSVGDHVISITVTG